MKNEYTNAMSNNPSLSDQRNQISLIHLSKRFCICKVAKVEALGMAIMHHHRQLCTSAMRGEIFQIFEFCTYDIVIQIGSNSFNYQSLLACSSCYIDIGCSCTNEKFKISTYITFIEFYERFLKFLLSNF